MKNLLLVLLCFVCSSVNAQTKNEVGMIVGNVLEAETGVAIDDVTVAIHKSADTTWRRHMLTDKNGNFGFENLPAAYYRLVISSINFATLTIDSIHVREERSDFNLGDLKLFRHSAELAGIIVYAEKPLIENSDGNIIYNVKESALSSGSSTAELLKNMPLISNDPEGKILLKGKEPRILIDDKPTELNAQQLADLLESLPGSAIEKIELMTNPPPQYASEEGGVINIITAKGKLGVIGRITISGGSRGEGNLAANISYRHKKIILNLNAGAALSRLTGENYSRRENYYQDSTNYFHTDGKFVNYNLRPNIRLQADYEINKKHSVNAVLQTNLNTFDNESNTQYKNINRHNDIYRLSTRRNISDGLGLSNMLTFTYTYKAIKTSERLQVIAGGNLGRNDNAREFYQQFLNPDYSASGIDSMQLQASDYSNHAFNFRVNYNKPLPFKWLSLSTGITFNRVNNHNILGTQFYQKIMQQFITNEMLSNDFKFLQDIYSARLALVFKLNKTWRLTTGVQLAETNNTFIFIKGNVADVSNGYSNWLPHATLRKDFSKVSNTSLVYRSTIRRPGIGHLNPNIDYSDPYNIRFGNPFLLPSLAHNIDWNYSYIKGKYNISTSVGYNKIKDVFNRIRTLVDNGVTELTYQNIADRQEYEASIWGGYTFNKRFRINGSAGYTYNQYGENEKQLYKYRDGGTFYTSFNYSYTPHSLMTFEGNARFSSFADPQGRARSNLTMNIGAQRKFFNKRLIVSINVIDPVMTQNMVTNTYGSRFTLQNFNSINTRNFRLSVAYQLNRIVAQKRN